MGKEYSVSIRNDTGIAQAMEKYCEENNISLNGFMVQAVKEKLAKMDVHSMSLTEIEDAEREYNENGRYI